MTTRTNLVLAGAVAVAAGFFGSSASAQAPALIPIQGVLTDDAGTPVDGDTTVQFSLYAGDLGGSPLYTETQTVAVAAGLFSIYLGDVTALELTIFRDNSVWLGVSIDGGVELSPRVQFATTPYAGYAAFAGDATTVGGVGAAGLVRSSVGAGISINASNEISVDRAQFDTWVTENVGAVSDANTQNHARFTDAEAVTAVSAADVYVRNAGDTVTGPLRVSSTLTVTGTIDAQGGITIACPTGKTHVGSWCMSTFRKAPRNLATAVSTCAAESAQVCPLAALVACQSAGTPAACVADTTPPGAISTSPGVLTGDFAPSGTTSITQRSIVYHSGVDLAGGGVGPLVTNVARVEDASGASLRYYCCTPVP
ncbi:MAG: hypothetical protein GXP55_06995 [Deltaproteobacteria bacterium]|nr:hypothetical protein [Deltaproteobacteria bacterium]